MKQKSLLGRVKEYWWLYGVILALGSATVLWGGLPARVAQAEQAIDDLKGWAKELQGYTRAQQEYNQQVQRQAFSPPIPEPEIIKDGKWCCKAYTYEQCWIEDEQGYNRWYSCE